MHAHDPTGANPATESMSAGAAPPTPEFRHEPVLLAEVLDFVPTGARLLVDATLGGGSHAAALLERHPAAELFGCDRDGEAVAAARARLAPWGERALVKQIAFSELPHHLLAHRVDFLLADLGVSSHQLASAPRGFSFTEEGPLDMRMDAAGGATTAGALVNDAPPERLVELMRRYGEERFAPRIVHAIVAARAEAPIETTRQLARLVAEVVPVKFQRRGFHPATRVFQALRIAVNDELGELGRLLDVAPNLLAPGGRIAVVSFHSLEDRLCKDRFRAWEQPCACPPNMPACVCGKVPLGRRVTRKPVSAGEAETGRNPRSRSAKLRVFELMSADELQNAALGSTALPATRADEAP